MNTWGIIFISVVINVVVTLFLFRALMIPPWVSTSEALRGIWWRIRRAYSPVWRINRWWRLRRVNRLAAEEAEKRATLES